MTYAYPYQNCDQTMMISSPTKLQHSVLSGYPDCGSNAYKNLMMYSTWQWPPTPECLSPVVRLPHINRFGASMASVPSPLTPITPSSHQAMCTVEPLSPGMHACAPMTQSPSPALNISMPGTVQFPKDNVLPSTPTGSKRGRPRADVISSLQYFGSNSTCTIRCRICHRVFPREKSLQAHLRTHTGERPYRCDYPNCTKSFVQSGQLKTHQRLHSGEKPFKCSEEECNVRFTHANRHCPDHPHAKLIRDDQGALEGLLVGPSRQDTAIADWLDKYVRTRLDRTNALQRPQFKRESSDVYPSSDEDFHHSNAESAITPKEKVQQEIITRTPLSTGVRGSSAKRQLLSDEAEDKKEEDQGEPAVRIPLSPKRINQNGQVLKVDPRHPVKKRILAYNQLLMKENQQQMKLSVTSTHSRPQPMFPPLTNVSPRQKACLDADKSPVSALSPIRCLLNKPLDEKKKSPKNFSFLQELESPSKPTNLEPLPQGVQYISPVKKNSKVDESDPTDRWNGALALMQLASSPPSRKMSSCSSD